MIGPLTVGVCPDFAEERWPSMDRVAAHLLAAIAVDRHTLVATEVLRPDFARRAMRWSTGPVAYSIDRACNRFVDYPRHLRRVAMRHDVYHVLDHSYAHLVHGRGRHANVGQVPVHVLFRRRGEAAARPVRGGAIRRQGQ